jgi:chromosomal replication initiation ATPase DnaA
MSALVNINRLEIGRSRYALTCVRPAAVRRIQAAVAQAYGFSSSEAILVRRRDPRIALARQVACYLSRKLTPCSLKEIARAFGQDHTTVMHGVRKIENFLKSDPTFAATIGQLEIALKRNLEIPVIEGRKLEHMPEWAIRLEAKVDLLLGRLQGL